MYMISHRLILRYNQCIIKAVISDYIQTEFGGPAFKL